VSSAPTELALNNETTNSHWPADEVICGCDGIDSGVGVGVGVVGGVWALVPESEIGY